MAWQALGGGFAALFFELKSPLTSAILAAIQFCDHFSMKHPKTWEEREKMKFFLSPPTPS
jgi:hypothetical protein